MGDERILIKNEVVWKVDGMTRREYGNTSEHGSIIGWHSRLVLEWNAGDQKQWQDHSCNV